MAGSGCNAYQIRKIYAIGGALGMVKRNEEDDLLHELVEGMTGKKSIKALTYGEACKVIGELEGRQGTPPPRKSGKPLRKTAPGHTSEGQRRKVWALMYRLQDASPMQAINIIRHSYNRLTDVQQAAQIWGVSQDDFLDCINYLAMAKYIQLRTIADKILVPDFADIGWDLLEAKLTAEGISVLCHKTKDEMIEV